MKNTLYYGDNLQVLRRHIADESVDLIYLDPPFKSNQDYNVLFEEQDGSRGCTNRGFRRHLAMGPGRGCRIRGGGGSRRTSLVAMRAFRTVLHGSDMLAYLSMMAPRLVEFAGY